MSLQLMPVSPQRNGQISADTATPTRDLAGDESELDVFRGEMLRQKIIFSSELRRQREVADKQISMLKAELAARDEEMKQMHRTVAALAARIETIESHPTRSQTPRSALLPPPTPADGVPLLALAPRPYRSSTPPSRPSFPTPYHEAASNIRPSRRLASPRPVQGTHTPVNQTLTRTPSQTPRGDKDAKTSGDPEPRPRSPRPTMQRPSGVQHARNSATFTRTMSQASSGVADVKNGNTPRSQWK